MKSTYSPKPGSAADRAIAYLQSQPPAGAEVSSAALAEAVGVASTSIQACMASALDAGAVFARKKGGHVRSPLFWSLVDHEAKHASTVAPVEAKQPPAQRVQEGAAGRSRRPATATETTTGRGAEPAGAAGDDATREALPAAPRCLRIALWSDGTLQVQRDGTDLVVLTQRETRQLVHYLDCFAEHEEAA